MKTDYHKTLEIAFQVLMLLAAIFLVYEGLEVIHLSNRLYEDSLKFANTYAAKNDCKLNLQPNYASVKEGYSQATSYFSLAAGSLIIMLLVPKLQNLVINKDGVSVTLQNLQQTVNSLVDQNNHTQSNNAGIGGKITANTPEEVKQKITATNKLAIEYPDDPEKGKWGELNEFNHREMTATVKHSKIPGFFKVTIRVRSTDPAKAPLTGLVNFHLHPTFDNPNPSIVAANNEAVLKLEWVYGSFTVGADMDGGKTKLEYDLATIPGAPKEFVEN